MKLLLLLALTIGSFNIFAAELGEDKKSECPYTNQTNKREAKRVVATETVKKEKEPTKGISK